MSILLRSTIFLCISISCILNSCEVLSYTCGGQLTYSPSILPSFPPSLQLMFTEHIPCSRCQGRYWDTRMVKKDLVLSSRHSQSRGNWTRYPPATRVQLQPVPLATGKPGASLCLGPSRDLAPARMPSNTRGRQPTDSETGRLASQTCHRQAEE